MIASPGLAQEFLGVDQIIGVLKQLEAGRSVFSVLFDIRSPSFRPKSYFLPGEYRGSGQKYPMVVLG